MSNENYGKKLDGMFSANKKGITETTKEKIEYLNFGSITFVATGNVLLEFGAAYVIKAETLEICPIDEESKIIEMIVGIFKQQGKLTDLYLEVKHQIGK